MTTAEAELAELCVGGDVETPGQRALRLTRLPSWPWARWTNTEWVQRCDARVVAAIRSWRPTAGPLLILGPTGAGKTSSLIAWAAGIADANDRRWVANGSRPHVVWELARYITSQDLGAAAREWRFGTPEPQLIEQAMGAKVLLLDELGPLCPPETLFRVLDARYSATLPTLACSGMTLAELTKTFGAAAVRRMVDNGNLVDAHARCAA